MGFYGFGTVRARLGKSKTRLSTLFAWLGKAQAIKGTFLVRLCWWLSIIGQVLTIQGTAGTVYGQNFQENRYQM